MMIGKKNPNKALIEGGKIPDAPVSYKENSSRQDCLTRNQREGCRATIRPSSQKVHVFGDGGEVGESGDEE
jgi:hypothetical protein